MEICKLDGKMLVSLALPTNGDETRTKQNTQFHGMEMKC